MRAGYAPAGIRRRSRESPSRRSRSTPRPPCAGRSCLPAWGCPAASAARRPSDVRPLDRPCSIRPSRQPSREVRRGSLEGLPVVLPCLPIDPRRRLSLQRGVGPAQIVDVVDVVQERREPHRLSRSATCRTRSSALSAPIRSLCPGRGVLARIPFSQPPSLHPLRRRFPGLVRELRRCWVGGGPPRPPSAAQTARAVSPHAAFTKVAARGAQAQGRNQRNKTHQPQLATEPRRRERLPPGAAPPLVPMGPQPSNHPPVELVEEPPHVSALVILAPPANHRIELADQPSGAQRNATPRLPANCILEPVDDLCVGDLRARPGLDLRGRKCSPPAALDRVPKECETRDVRARPAFSAN